MNRYELTYIINTGLEDTARKELIEKFTGLIQQNGGEVEKVDETWGKRHLAYPINDMLEGYYVLVTFQSVGDLPREIERNLEINESVLRYLIIKLLNKKQSVKPRPVRVQAPVAPPPPVETEAAPTAAQPPVEVVEVVEIAQPEGVVEVVEIVEAETPVAEEASVDSAE